jgi:hypothetical protein
MLSANQPNRGRRCGNIPEEPRRHFLSPKVVAGLVGIDSRSDAAFPRGVGRRVHVKFATISLLLAATKPAVGSTREVRIGYRRASHLQR